MQTVSNDFLTAIVATEREIKQKTELVLLDNSMLGVAPFYSASSTCDATLTPTSNAFNGKIKPQKKFGWVGNDIYPTEDVYPVGDDGSSDIGWWSDTLSDGSAEFDPAETLTVDYETTQTIQSVKVYGDLRLGYPVDFSVHYATVESPGTEDWTEITSVTGNTLTEWNYSLPSAISALHLRLSITKWSEANKRAKIIEFEGGYSVWITDDISSISITKERSADDEGTTLPYGNSSANEISVVVDNTDDAFYQRNTSSPYYGYIKTNRKIRNWLGVKLPSGSIEYCPQGTYYTVSFNAALMSPEATIRAWDKAKRMMEKDFTTSIVYEGKTLSELAEIIALDYGLTAGEYIIDSTTETMPYSYFERARYWTHLNNLAKGETGQVYYDELERLIFENRGHHYSSRLASQASAGASSIVVASAYGLVAGDTIYLDDNTNSESVTIDSSWDGSTAVTLTSNLTNSYAANSYVYKQPVVATFQESDVIIDIDDQYVLDKARNKIEVKATPLIVPLDGLGSPAIETVWQLDEPITIPAGDHENIDIFFTKEPVIYNDDYDLIITVSTDPEGDESYITTSWQPSTPYAWGGHLRISNSHTSDVEVVGLIIDGVPLETAGGIIEKAEDTTLQATQGERSYSLESRFIQRKAHALAIANNLLRIWKDPSAPLKCKGRGMPHLQLGDHVKVISTRQGLTNANLNNHFILTRIVLDYDGGLTGEYDLLAL